MRGVMHSCVLLLLYLLLSGVRCVRLVLVLVTAAIIRRSIHHFHTANPLALQSGNHKLGRRGECTGAPRNFNVFISTKDAL